MDLNKELSEYLASHTSPEDKLLSELYRETHLKAIYPEMISGHYQGKFLELISKLVRPKYALEIGTFTGYSAICMARGLAEGGRLFTIDRNEEIIPLARKYFKKAGLDQKIEILTGNALDIIPGLGYMFDLVFIDGDKPEYRKYYELVIDKTSPGGILIADNALWYGKVLKSSRSKEKNTLAIRHFNDMIRDDRRVENILLPIRDGLMIVRKSG